jgi:lysophospholipase L1-like esterase
MGMQRLRAFGSGVLLAAFWVWLGPASNASGATCASTPPNLIGWWPADGNANDIFGTNNGILQGGATASSAGLVGSAFSFAGTNGYVQIPDAPELKPVNLTVEAWVRFTSLDSQGLGGSPAGDQYIVFKQNSYSSSFEGFDLSKTRSPGPDVFRWMVSSGPGLEAEIHSITPLTTNVWYHVAGVRGSNFLQIYVNGQLEQQTNVSFPQNYGTLPLFFGTSGQAFWDHKFRGSLDEVALYNRALSSNEIAAIFAIGAVGKCKAPSISTAPQSQAVIAGNSALFTVVATGLAPLSYQWQFNGAAIGGATSTNLLLNNMQPVNGGNYSVVVSNKLSSVTSAVAILTVLVPPSISSQPQSRTNVAGSPATFSVSASGTAPLSYQWQFNVANISGATGANLTLDNVQPANTGDYAVVVTNGAGTVTSVVATLTVWVPPSITSQPQSRTNVLGTAVTFSVTATGMAPLTYQWQLNGANIGGATGANLSLNNVQISDAGSYTVVLTNTAGAVTSAIATLTVWAPPAISSQPQSRTNLSGTVATFNVTATGATPLSYQWQLNGTAIPGANGASLILNSVQAVDAGNYTVAVTNVLGAVTSAVATLTVWVPPAIISQPRNQTNMAGTTASFSIGASGTVPLSYQWQFNGGNLAGATGTNLVLNNVQPADAGGYAAIVSNGAGAVTSLLATLTVVTSPTFFAQPQSRTNVAGTAATFSAGVSGTLPLSYQWQFNGVSIPGATTTNLLLNNVQPTHAGNYALVATNTGGSATSTVAVLTILVPPSITTQPQSRTNIAGTTATFNAVAAGTTPLAYQWLLNGAAINSATTSSLALGNVQSGDAGSYSLVVTNNAGAVASAVATLTVWMPPVITGQPQNRTNAAGTTAIFNVAATGTAPLAYQWQLNGTNISGAVNPILILSNVQPSATGSYLVVVTNSAGAATSAVAALTVLVPPAIAAQPANRTNALGTTAVFSALATGSLPLSYRWLFNGVNLSDGGQFSGTTTPSLSISAVAPENAGAYSVLVTNSAGSVISATAILTVPVPDCFSTPTGLIAWWPGDGNANDIFGVNNGILQGGATASAAGLVGSAFSFDGTNGYVQISDAPQLKPTNLTVEAWVRFASLDSQGSGGSPLGDQYMVFKQNTNNASFEGFDLSKTRSGGTDVFRWMVSSGSGLEAEIHSATTLTTNVWYHVAGVRGSNFIQLYVNGQLERQTNVSFVQSYGTLPLFFGTSGQSFWDHKLRGSLDEVALYNRPLSSNEIAAIFAIGAVGKCKAPNISVAPQSQTVIAGNSALFTVVATGLAPLGYQWQFNGAAIGGATSSNLLLNNVQPVNGGSYTVVVSNKLSSVTSAVATLTVLVPPAITSQPKSRTNVLGTVATFNVVAGGTTPLNYQWQLNGAPMAGATGTSITLNNVQPGDAGGYTVVVTNVAGTITSAVATLAVWVPPAITSQPQSRTNISGTTATFTVSASGTAPLNYQWQLNGANIGGATASSLALNNVQPPDTGSYSVVVTNGAGAVTSTVVTLTVWVAPSISVQPQSRTNVSGTVATFSVTASGTAPLSYQWLLNGAAIPGATTTSLVLNNVQPSDAGAYTVVITNVAATLTSAVATLTVWVPPAITSQPQSQTNVAGTIASFSVNASGTPPPSYQWTFNGAAIADASGTSLVLNNVQPADAGNYAVLVTNGAGAVTSSFATLTVVTSPLFTIQPQSRTNVAGTDATFNASATGTLPLSYQWQVNSASIPGATTANLLLSNVQPPDAGNYTLVASNIAGIATSSVAVLTVQVAPAFTLQPLSRTNFMGTDATFIAAAIGTSPLSYQWQFNNLNLADGGRITGAASNSLTIAGVQAGDAGAYTVVAANAAGVATSIVASLTVVVPPTITSQPGNSTVVAGGSAGFSVNASGTPPLSYQWQLNGTNLINGNQINGVTNSTLSIIYVLPLNVGGYSVIVSNAAGSVSSLPASLQVTLPNCAAITSGLAAWWPGDGTAKDIGGTNHGALMGSANANATGFVGGAFSLDGTNGSVQIPDSAALKPTNLTIEAWVSFAALDSSRSGAPPPGQQYIVFKQNTRTNNFEGYALAKTRTGSNDFFSFTVSSAGGQSVTARSISLVSTGLWYHVVAVRGPNLLQLYINGQLEGQTNLIFSQDYANLPLLFGSSGQSYNDGKFCGLLDEVCLFSRALSAAEIASDYSSAIVGKCKAPVILSQPQGGARYWGGAITLSSSASGALPLSYQWQKDGLPLPGATTTSLVMSNLPVASAGNYSLFVSNAYGVTLSAPASLTVKVADFTLALPNGGGQQNQPGLTIVGLPGQVYGIQYAAGFAFPVNWIGLTNLVLTSPTNVWYDPQPATNPQRYYRVVAGPIPIGTSSWEASPMGTVWSDDFNRASLGTNWIILGGANASISTNELLLSQSNVNLSRQIYYDPWLTSSDEFTIRWSHRFSVINSTNIGVGVGIKNFQAAGGNDRGYNGQFAGAGANAGRMVLQRFDGSQMVVAATGSPISFAAGNIVDCTLSRDGWTMTATASNRANGQFSSCSLVYSDPANLIAPTISRVCIYPIQGTVYLDNISFTINHSKPARVIIIGASLSEGYDASSYSNGYVRVMQRTMAEAICNDSSSYNTTTNAVSVLQEILSHQPGTAFLSMGGNDMQFGYPPSVWQTGYSNLVAQLQMAGVVVKHGLPPPRNVVDVRPLRDFIITNYPAKDVIDLWTPLVQGASGLNPAYDIGDGVHLNDAGHLLMGTIVRTNLPP